MPDDESSEINKRLVVVTAARLFMVSFEIEGVP